MTRKKLFYCILILLLLILIILIAVKFINKKPMEGLKGILQGKKVALVIAQEGFQDQEFSETKKGLEQAEAEVYVVSKNTLFPAKGKFGLEVEPDIKLENLRVDEFDALVFIGGPGASSYIEDDTVHSLIRKAKEKDKVLGAICIAPTILAKAGVLKDVQATVWSSPLDKSPVELLKETGAIYLDEPVVVSGKIVTANGPEAAKKFAQALVEVISKQ